MRTHAGKQADLPSERTLQNLHAIAGHEWPPRELHQPTHLARADLGDNCVGNARRATAIHDQTTDTGPPMGRAPLQLNSDEAVARKQRRLRYNLATVLTTHMTQAGKVGLKAGQPQIMQRQAFALRLEPRRGPGTSKGLNRRAAKLAQSPVGRDPIGSALSR
jgi:hypothetical protein